MRLRRRNTPPPDDEFLRALEARDSSRAPADQSPGGEAARVPDDGDHDAEGLGAALSEAEARAARAEASLVQVRDEAERRLADARSAIERERKQRDAVGQRLEQAQEELARKAAELEERESRLAEQPAETARDVDDDLDRRRRELIEEEKRVSERWERWELEAQREAERRAAELAEAERQIAEARAALEKDRIAGAGEIGTQEPVPGEAQAVGAAVRPVPGGGRMNRILRPLRRDSAQPSACATCARPLPSDDVGRARDSGWELAPFGEAICPACLAEGWHFPDGALVPVRSRT